MKKTPPKLLRLAAVGCFLLLTLGFFSPSAAVADGCDWENCWTCVDYPYGGYCWPVYGNGRLCCSEYMQGDNSVCRAFDYYCYGVVVWG